MRLAEILPHFGSLLLRTDGAHEAEWRAVVELSQRESPEGCRAGCHPVDDTELYGAGPDDLLIRLQGHRTFVIVADERALLGPAHPLLVLGVSPEPGRTFRVEPAALWSVENNLSISNMDFHEFADNVDDDGVFRGF